MASLSTTARPQRSSRTTPQWPWSVNSSRQVSAMSSRSSPNSSRMATSVRLSTPSSRQEGVPSASLSSSSGTPNRSTHRTPASRASWAARLRESRVCWCTPGIEEISRGASMPSAMNIGRMRSAGRRAVSATSSRIAALERRRRGRRVGTDRNGVDWSVTAGAGPSGESGSVGLPRHHRRSTPAGPSGWRETGRGVDGASCRSSCGACGASCAAAAADRPHAARRRGPRGHRRGRGPRRSPGRRRRAVPSPWRWPRSWGRCTR